MVPQCLCACGIIEVPRRLGKTRSQSVNRIGTVYRVTGRAGISGENRNYCGTRQLGSNRGQRIMVGVSMDDSQIEKRNSEMSEERFTTGKGRLFLP